MSSSYIWCNSYKLTLFLHRKFLRNLTVKKTLIKCYCFSSYYLINASILSLSPYLLPQHNLTKKFENNPLFIAFHLITFFFLTKILYFLREVLCSQYFYNKL